MEKILFSCLGTSDPVRGLRDGPMLHVVRHYKPDKIFWFVSAEMKKNMDSYYKAIASIEEQCEGYHPEILEPYYSDIEDVSDFDVFYEPFTKILEDLHRRYPNAQFLANISSGSPQMKSTLALLTGTLKFNLKAIQVKNPERQAGTAMRSNDKKYELDVELELNEDAQEGAENRCTEPKLYTLFRDRQAAQVKALLKRYDYDALLQMRKTIPDSINPIVAHLAYRSSYNMEDAVKTAQDIKDIDLYPAKSKGGKAYNTYREISEYVLILKLMQRTQKYTDMIIRLNPFVIKLQREWLVSKGINFADIARIDSKGSEIVDSAKMTKNNKELMEFIDNKYQRFGGFKDSPLNIIFCNHLIDFLNEAESETAKFFKDLERLNFLRNSSAHSLRNLTDKDIEDKIGINSNTLIKKLINVIAEIYPEYYTPELFSIYDTANNLIKERL